MISKHFSYITCKLKKKNKTATYQMLWFDDFVSMKRITYKRVLKCPQSDQETLKNLMHVHWSDPGKCAKLRTFKTLCVCVCIRNSFIGL